MSAQARVPAESFKFFFGFFSEYFEDFIFKKTKKKFRKFFADTLAQTAPFNEYYLLAYLAMVHEADGSTRAKTFFEDCFGVNGKPVGRDGYPRSVFYNNHELMSDGHWYLSTFTLQFPWFAVKDNVQILAIF